MRDSGRDLKCVVLGAALAAVIGLSATAYGVFSPSVLEHYADSPDSVGIARWAERTTLGDLLGCWVGPWIQRDSFYYRPLASMLLWLEYKAFGWDFQGYVIISWLVHGCICVCLYLLAMSVYPGDIRRRAAFAVLAVLLFNVRLGPAGPMWRPQPVSYGVVAWWPAQTDQMSLAFALCALLVFEGWLRGSRRNGLLLATVLWVVALLFKEMAVSLPLVASCLVLYHKGWASARVWSVEDTPEGPRRRLSLHPQAAAPSRHSPSLGLFWKVLLPGLFLSAAFLGLRWLLVAGAWGPRVKGPLYFARKALWFAAERPVALVGGRGAPLVIVSAFLACCVYVYARLPRRPSVVWLVLTVAIGAGVLEQVLAGSFAMLTIPHELAALGTMTLFILGIAVLLHARTGPAWPLLGVVVAVHLPILHVWGPHYLYWPVAFWGLLNASLVLYVWERKADRTLQWRKREPSATA